VNRLAVVSATLDTERSRDCRLSWPLRAGETIDVYLVNGGVIGPRIQDGWETRPVIFGGRRSVYYTNAILGVVPAYAIGVQRALEDGCEIIACFHDDLLIEQEEWATQVLALFDTLPAAGLVGFGGGTGLADDTIYQTEYDPMQLARKDFVSNMRDAEAHGRRRARPVQVACLDGFSQIGRAEFWRGKPRPTANPETVHHPGLRGHNLFSLMQSWGITHHAYDSALGCFARRLGWETWMVPVACHHFGGQTAVADGRYHAWANDTTGVIRDRRGHMATGDQGFWLKAHEIVFDQFKDVLPIRL
jgi:hypothetical protein